MSVDILERPQISEVAPRQQVKILIIDDDAAQAGQLARRLGRQGFATVWADSGEAGLVLARSKQPTLVVLDLRLPGTDALAVCQRLVDDPATCGIPVILLGGTRLPDMVRRCRAAGCHFFLRTPYDPNVLLVLIRQALADSSGSWE
jgi:CheY-like chemotaxis protein